METGRFYLLEESMGLLQIPTYLEFIINIDIEDKVWILFKKTKISPTIL